MRMSTLEFRNGYVLDERSGEPIQMPAVLVRDTLELPVNGKKDLLVQTTCKSKTGSIRFDHSDIFTSVSVRETVKTIMNLKEHQHEVGALTKYVRFLRMAELQLSRFRVRNTLNSKTYSSTSSSVKG